MAGGGWKNHASWGPGPNPLTGGKGATPDIRRWMIKVVLLKSGLSPEDAITLLAMLGSDDPSLINEACEKLGASIERLFRALIGKMST